MRLKELKEIDLATEAQVALAKGIKNISNGDGFNIRKGRNKEKKRQSIKTGSSQDMVPVRNIEKGLIRTIDNRYVQIVEISPSNYRKMSSEERRQAIFAFGSLFAKEDFKWQFKIVNDTASAKELLSNIRDKNQGLEEGTPVYKAVSKYMEFAYLRGRSGAVATRYFIIYEYEGSSKDINEIREEMTKRKNFIRSCLRKAGNDIVTDARAPLTEERMYQIEASEQLSYLYLFFNRRTSEYENVNERTQRMKFDYYVFNEETKNEKRITVADMVAPKGLYLNNRKYIFMDGQYYSFLGIKANHFPTKVNPAWLDSFAFGSMVDIDVICKRLHKQTIINSLKLINNVADKRVREAANRRDYDKYEKRMTKFNANKYIQKSVEAGENLYDTTIILTVRGNSEREVARYIDAIKDEVIGYGVEFEDTFDNAEEYLLMTMPLLFITRPFGRLKHNMLAHQLSTIYPFTAYSMYDKKGFIIGINNNSQLTVLDPFNSKRFSNANILVTGSSGVGKTFFLNLMSTRLFFNGVTCYFILPKKARDFLNASYVTGGTFVRLTPSSKDCVNILEIRPEKAMDSSIVDATLSAEDTGSLVAKKITSLSAWLTILYRDTGLTSMQRSEIEVALGNLYASFGIYSDDNDSIYEVVDGEKRLKVMPTIKDMQKEFYKHELLTPIADVLQKFTRENSPYANFCGQTNVPLNSKFIVFDCDEDKIGSEDLPTILYIAFDFCYDKVKDINSEKSMIFMDEVWKMMNVPEAALQVQNMIKLVRGYGAGCTLATQEFRDFVRDKDGYGRSVINNTAIKLYLHMEPDDLKMASTALDFTKSQAQTIAKLEPKLEGLVVANKEEEVITIQASQYEIEQFSDKTSKN